MSEETARKLEECRAIEAQRRREVNAAKQSIIPEVERQIREGLTAYAKNVTLTQTGISREIGVDGIRALRADLSAAVDDLMARLRTTVESDWWPPLQNGRGGVYNYFQPGVIDDGIKDFLAREVPALVSPLNSRGFIIGVPRAGIPYGENLAPDALYKGNGTYAELVEALVALAEAAAATSEAVTADDKDFVSSLWEE